MKEKAFQVLETKAQILEDQELAADMLRAEFQKKGVILINLMASPGAGKTTTLVRTIHALKDKYRIGVIEADADGDVDSRTIAETGVKVVQVHTGGSCHMDVHMTKKGLDALGIDELDVIFLENVGNLVCPAEFDIGANVSVMILSTPEGHDKPLKYPLMFQVSDCLLVNKMDVAPVFDFDIREMKKGVLARNPDIRILPVSAATGEGFGAWIDWLITQIEKCKNSKGGRTRSESD